MSREVLLERGIKIYVRERERERESYNGRCERERVILRYVREIYNERCEREREL